MSEEKYEFFLPQINCLGQIINESGKCPDLSRADAIRNMPASTNIPTIQAFLGLVNYHQSYIPNVHKLRVPLNDLLKKGSKVELVH